MSKWPWKKDRRDTSEFITKGNREILALYLTASNFFKKYNYFTFYLQFLAICAEIVLEIRKNLLLQLLKSMQYLLGYVIYAYNSKLCVTCIFFYFFPLFLCCIQYTPGNLKYREKRSLKKFTSAAQASVVSLFLIPWPDFDASQLRHELGQQKKEVISSRQTGFLQMPVLLSSEKKRRIPVYKEQS